MLNISAFSNADTPNYLIDTRNEREFAPLRKSGELAATNLTSHRNWKNMKLAILAPRV